MTKEGYMRHPFMPAYYQRRWVLVPLRYIPKEAEEDEGREKRIARYKSSELYEHEFDPIPKRICKSKEEIVESTIEVLDPDSLSDKDLKKLCRMNHIHLSWIIEHSSKKFKKISSAINRREQRKSDSLSREEFKRLNVALKSPPVRNRLSKSSALIARLLWFLNRELSEVDSYVTLQELLYLQVEHVSPVSSDGLVSVELNRRRETKLHITLFLLTKGLSKSLCDQITNNSPFIFSNKYDGPLDPDDVNRYIKQAGERAVIEGIVTSRSLRAAFDKAKAKKNFSVKEFEKLCRKIPGLVHTKGRRPTYSPRDMLNAILYHLDTGCPFRKFPDSFPPGKTVHLKYMRWKKQGVIKEVLRLRGKKDAF